MADEERLSEPSERLNTLGERRRELAPGRAGDGARLLCAGSDLADGGDGVRFEIEHKGETVPAFAIRHGGRVYAYLNRCAHIAMELDWNPGKFFDSGRRVFDMLHARRAVCAGKRRVPRRAVSRRAVCAGSLCSRLTAKFT